MGALMVFIDMETKEEYKVNQEVLDKFNKGE